MKSLTTVLNIRRPAFAGTFYPDDPRMLRQMVEQYLEGAVVPPATNAKAYVLPHAGYVYSGSVAAAGYRGLHRQRDGVERIVLLGPSHRVAYHGLAFSNHDLFETPLGRIPVDREAIETICGLPQVIEFDEAHRREHSLEVHLPFLQVVLRQFTLVPLVVGDVGEEQVSEVLERLWGGDETRIVISSDLSHYHDYQTACRLDRDTASRIEGLQSVVPEQACGAVPLDGLIHALRLRQMSMSNLDLRNSGDTVGSRDRVVGYGAFAAF
jgi:MEMO1 family protein